MNFTAYVEEQLHLHPATQPRDVIKQCYQAAKELLQSLKSRLGKLISTEQSLFWRLKVSLW